MKTKYDWSNVPDEVTWIATDSNGIVFGYDVAPVAMDFGKLMAYDSLFLYYPHTGWMQPFKGNWRESLEQRP